MVDGREQIKIEVRITGGGATSVGELRLLDGALTKPDEIFARIVEILPEFEVTAQYSDYLAT